MIPSILKDPFAWFLIILFALIGIYAWHAAGREHNRLMKEKDLTGQEKRGKK